MKGVYSSVCIACLSIIIAHGCHISDTIYGEPAENCLPECTHAEFLHTVEYILRLRRTAYVLYVLDTRIISALRYFDYYSTHVTGKV